LWRCTENPIIPRNPLPGVARIFNSAVMPYEGAYIGVFRGEQTNGIPYIYLGRSADGIHWTPTLPQAGPWAPGTLTSSAPPPATPSSTTSCPTCPTPSRTAATAPAPTPSTTPCTSRPPAVGSRT